MKCEWDKIQIGDLGTIVTGKTPSTKKSEYWGGTVPFVTPKDLQGTKHIFQTERSITDIGMENVKGSKLPPNAICVSCIGNIGYVGVTTKSCISNQQINSIVANKNYDVNYIYYLMKSLWPFFKNYEGQSTTLSILNKTQFSKIEIQVPKFEIQKRIAGILSLLDDKIELNNKINENLYEMVNTYYKSIFKNLTGNLTTIGSYSERIYSGGTPTTSNVAYWNGDLSWLSSGESRNRFITSTEKTITQLGVDNSSTKLAKKYDIVMASAGQGFTRGQTSMLLLDTYVNQSVIVIHAERNVLPYLFWNLANRYGELRAISDSSSIRGSLTTKMISAFQIPLANESDLEAFSDFAWSVIPQIETNLLENKRLSVMRNSLLPKLMSGEIDVEDVKI